MTTSAENGGGMDSSYAAAKDKTELQTNTSKIRRGASPTLKDASSASATSSTASSIGKTKRKVPTTTTTTTTTAGAPARSAKTSREPSPTRLAGSKTPQTQGQHQTSVNASASRAELLQPRPPHPLPNTPRLTVPRTSPSRQPAPAPRKKTETFATPAVASAIFLPQEGSEQAEEPDNHGLLPGMRTPRSNSAMVLETVVESSLPTTPAIGSSVSLEDSVAALIQRQPSTPSTIASTIPEEMDTDSASTITRKGRTGSVSSSIAPMSTAESESESSYRSGDRTPTYRVPPPARVYGRPRPVTSKDPSSSKAMTVETETVSSVPQVGLGAVGPAGGASLRSKKSTDTIKAPKREKKRAARRPGAPGPSNPSSKIDIFAAKIAEAVDEVNSSDSEETFVYESNPPESSHHPHQRPTSRFHSRTPSATSIGPDPRGQRLPVLSTIDSASSAGRKGMKFVNNSLNKETSFGGDGVPGDGLGGERGGPGSSREHHGRGDRNGGRHHNPHRSILPDDGPFHRPSHKQQSAHVFRSAAASSIMSSRQSSRPPSPKHTVFRNGSSSGGGKRSPRTRVYEADVENGDNEHTPLMPSGRSRPKRRPLNGSVRQMEHNARRRGLVRTYAGCIVAVVAILLILTGVGGFLVATTNALQGVRVLNVTDVLVSKQEIMLDLIVEAINPNAIAVTVGNMDVNIFAKSYGDGESDGGHDGGHDGDHEGDWFGAEITAGTNEHHLGRVTMELPKRLYPPSTLQGQQRNVPHNVDGGTDPPEDLPENETMLLGRIFSFDSVLMFEGSPWRRLPTTSTGELRLAKPGNKTEEGGSARWEKVLLHPFELIVRGVLKYQLPLSGRVRTAPISGSVMIHPQPHSMLL